MIDLYDCTEKERLRLLNNCFNSMLADYIRWAIWSQSIWLVSTQQPIRNPKDFIESGMNAKEIKDVQNLIKVCAENPTKQNLAELYAATEIFQPPYKFRFYGGKGRQHL